MMTRLARSLAALAVVALAASPALAKEARCFTTDDGEYPCDFVVTDKQGSFEISAPGYPSFAVVIDSPGVAWVYGTYEEGGRSVALPGPYLRAGDDRACWENSDTQARICAW